MTSKVNTAFIKCLLFLIVAIHLSAPTCVWDSDFGFKLNCAFKKAGLFRVRNLGGIKAHASLGFSLGDELGFEQSLTNLDPSRRRSVSVKNGAPQNLADSSSRPNVKMEKRGKQNRIMMRPQPINARPNPAAMESLSSLHRRAFNTMQPIVVGSTDEAPVKTKAKPAPEITMAKPFPMGMPPFKPLPPKDEPLSVVPLSPTKKTYTPLQIPQAKGPGLAYQSENNYPRISHDQVSKMVSQMTAATHIVREPHIQTVYRITPEPMIVENYTPRLITSRIPVYQAIPTTINPFVPMPASSPPAQAGLSIIPAPILKDSVQLPLAPSMLSKTPTAYSLAQNTISIHRSPPSDTPNLVSNFVDPVPKHVNDLANRLYPAYNTKKIDDYNSITGYSDDTVLTINKQEINEKIAEIAKAGNISMEAVEAAIALRQQQLLNKYASIPVPTSTTTTTTTTTTTEIPIVFESEPEHVFAPAAPPKKRHPAPVTGKVMNAPKEYYPVGYEKNFDDHFQSKVDLPDTNFHCGDQKYFPGLYGDVNLGCMVFHVCALTDDGLVMKSFLCPESTLFDQTILKCNWWFYVDCKNTRKLYETNIPVSKSYQLMKALTFFSNYKKEMQDDAGHPTNPEDVEGINQAITILENQDKKTSNDQSSVLPTIEVISAQTVDPRNTNSYKNNASDISPVYNHRINRNYRNETGTSSKNSRPNDSIPNISEIKPVVVKPNIEKSVSMSISAENSSKERNIRHRQRPKTSVGRPFSLFVTPNSKEESNAKRRRTVELKTKTTSTTTTTVPTITSSSSTTTTTRSTDVKGIEPKEIENFNAHVTKEVKSVQSPIEKEEKLADPNDTQEKILDDIRKEAKKSPAVKRFHRSSLESASNEEMIIVNNEKVQIVRPKAFARLVGQYPTPTAVIERLDEAILGRPNSSKKETTVTIVTPERTEDSIQVSRQTQKT